MLPNEQMDGSEYEQLLQQQELMSNDLTSEMVTSGEAPG
jgi:hypothetical protein